MFCYINLCLTPSNPSKSQHCLRLLHGIITFLEYPLQTCSNGHLTFMSFLLPGYGSKQVYPFLCNFSYTIRSNPLRLA